MNLGEYFVLVTHVFVLVGQKLREASSDADDAVGGREYERRLRGQYEKINPTPRWASAACRKLHLTG